MDEPTTWMSLATITLVKAVPQEMTQTRRFHLVKYLEGSG